VGAAVAHYPPLRDAAGPWLCRVGGEVEVACLGAAALLGIAWADRERAASSVLLATATGLVFLVLAALGAGPLGWRYFGQRLRSNYPDATGTLCQTTGITCAAAAASMLLYRSGIRISEGELAELAHTSPIQGTAPYALARAVDIAARRHGLRGRIQRVDYARAWRLGHPFLAFVNRPGEGGHALCVLKADSIRVWTIDPLSGTPETVPRAQFIAAWDPIIVWVTYPRG
jgi:hypothetical protein